MGETYSAFREQELPTYYPPNKTAVTADVLEVGFIFAFVILFFSFLVILPGVRGSQRIYSLIRVTVSLFIGAGIMLSLFGQEWEIAELHDVETYYKAFSPYEIHADIGVKIGLNSVNITLKGKPTDPLNPDEIINYNERFHFYGGQGRNGFGRFSGRINREFREAQWSGKPYPILWIAEYFTLDGEIIRWGRSYRMAGYYSYIMVWLAFPLWILANILFFMVIRNGAYFLILTGGSLLTANVLYSTIRYGSELKIPFSADHILEFHKGPSFILCLVAGLVAVICGFIVLALDYWKPLEIASFFNVDPLQDFEDTFLLDDKPLDGASLDPGTANGDGAADSAPRQQPSKGRFEFKSKRHHHAKSVLRRPRSELSQNEPASPSPLGEVIEEREEEEEESSTPTNPKTSEQSESTSRDIPLQPLGDTQKSPTTDM